MKTIYVAGPLTNGEPWLNVRKAILVADRLILCEFIPYVPHLAMFSDMIGCHHPYGTWLQMGMTWVEKCDGLMVIPGKSHGTECEIAHAKKHNKPLALLPLAWEREWRPKTRDDVLGMFK